MKIKGKEKARIIGARQIVSQESGGEVKGGGKGEELAPKYPVTGLQRNNNDHAIKTILSLNVIVWIG